MARQIDYFVLPEVTWRPQREELQPINWQCGFCSQYVGAAEGWRAVDRNGNHYGAIMICPRCRRPTLFEGKEIPFPASPPGEPIPNVPEPVNGMYEEARACVAAGAPRAAALACRTTLMYVATELNGGQQIKGGFQANVDWLFDNHWIPPNGKGWVDYIRDKGNDATHQIMDPDPDLARQLVDFLGMLLRFVYDMPRRLAPPTTPPPAPSKLTFRRPQ